MVTSWKHKGSLNGKKKGCKHDHPWSSRRTSSTTRLLITEVMEQPWGSAMWHPGTINPLDMDQIPGNKKKQRVDQCMHGAVDEQGNPTQKATGLGGNVKWSRTAIRCSGHGGKGHAHLQGAAPGGINRTAAAAIVSSWNVPKDEARHRALPSATRFDADPNLAQGLDLPHDLSLL